jgi:hypothetical protein
MNIEDIVLQLRAERDRIEKAIVALEHSGSQQPAKNGFVAEATPKKRGRKPMTPTQRRQFSLLMKKRWAERKQRQSAAQKKTTPVKAKKVAGASSNKKQSKKQTAPAPAKAAAQS